MLQGSREQMNTSARFGSRDAFTIIEMMLAVTIMLLVFAMAVPVFRSQLVAMDSHAGRADAQQNVRFAISTIDRELRVAGSGVLDNQPMIVQASPFAVTFNADLATRDTASEGGAFGAVYLDPDLPAGSTMSMLTSARVTLPLSSTQYPDTVYRNGAGLYSAAETISFWVAPDASPGSNGRFALYRRVNSGVVDTLARGLVIRATEAPPFTYVVTGSGGVPQDVPASQLPAYHAPIHGSPADTGATSRLPSTTDAIRAVRIHLVGTWIERDGSRSERPADAYVRLMNAGLLKHSTCGEPPVFGKALTAAYQATPTRRVVLSWAPALDETGGEKDVDHYAIFRRAAATPSYGEPIASVPAGQASYQFTDTQLPSGQTVVYAVAAFDCGSQPSQLSEAGQLTLP